MCTQGPIEHEHYIISDIFLPYHRGAKTNYHFLSIGSQRKLQHELTIIINLFCSFFYIFKTLSTYQWKRQWHPTPVLLPGKSHGWRSLVGYSPQTREESDMTEQLHFHFSLSCIGEGNGNPLQCSCLKNPRDSEAWWAAVYGVAHSRTRLMRLSSSSSSLLSMQEHYV